MATSDFSTGGFDPGGGGGSYEPPQILFCVNQLPQKPNGIYLWLDTGVWDDANSWIDG